MKRPKMLNNRYNNRPLFEGLQYRDLEGMMKPTIHVDEFAAKMGDDDDIIVISFFVRDQNAAKDLVNWFEKGYDFVLDADRSPGEIRPGRYLVYVEIRRRSAAPGLVQELLTDLGTLTEYEPDQWIMHYNNQDHDWSEDTFADLVPLTPDAYRERHSGDLNEMRVAAGLTPRPVHDTTRPDLRALKSAAGIL